jgi:hypothetical protein
VYSSNVPVGQQKKAKDIEEEDFIYKVPCAPRETISLRDSQYVSKNKLQE